VRLVFATYKPLHLGFTSDSRAALFNNQVTTRIGSSIRPDNNLEAQELQELACKQFKHVTIGALSRDGDFLEIDDWHFRSIVSCLLHVKHVARTQPPGNVNSACVQARAPRNA
jgi:hypothetical protein